MALTPSTMLELGTKAPAFSLRDVVTGRTVTNSDFAQAKGLLVMFICNHCPYVKHIREVLAERSAAWMSSGLGVVGINSNDVKNYPDDSPEKMIEEARAAGYRFPYLFDEDQAVARAYRAACTPDFFLFDRSQALVYRGQFDASRPGNEKSVTGADLDQAVQAVINEKPVKINQLPSVGCNIKWKPGQEPEYFRRP